MWQSMFLFCLPHEQDYSSCQNCSECASTTVLFKNGDAKWQLQEKKKEEIQERKTDGLRILRQGERALFSTATSAEM